MCVSSEEETWIYVLVENGYHGDQVLTAFWTYQEAQAEAKRLSTNEVEGELFYSISIRRIPLM